MNTIHKQTNCFLWNTLFREISAFEGKIDAGHMAVLSRKMIKSPNQHSIYILLKL
jgi:hypothetical protein